MKTPSRSRGYYRFRAFRHGQSLVELLIAVGIGMAMILAAITVIAPAIKSSAQVTQSQMAGAAARELMDNVRSWTEQDWHGLYTLSKTSSSPYFMIAGTSSIGIATGTESIVSDGVSSGLIGYWKFDEATGSRAFDSSGQGNNLTWNGTGVHQGLGKFQNAGQFNGIDDYASFVPTSIATGTFSVMFWAMPADVLAVLGVVGSREFPVDYSFDAKFQSSTIVHGDIGNGIAWYTKFADAPLSYKANVWYHVAYVVQPVGYTIYVNGNSVASGSFAGGSIPLLWDANHPFRVGHTGYTPTPEYFNGKIDEVRVYNRALSSGEVQKIYAAGFSMRYFYVDNVVRNALGYIDPAGSTDDPSTQKVTVVYSWPTLSTARSFVSYFTRHGGRAAMQSDWTGGEGQSTGTKNFGNKFATSTNIDYTTSTGAIVIQGY